MSLIKNLFTTPIAVLLNWGSGLIALGRLIGMGLNAAFGKDGTFTSRITASFLLPEGQRRALTVLRAFLPNLVLSARLVKCYENTGTAIVTRRQDVLEVLNNNSDFEVVYEPRMREITDGTNFFLGMQPSWDYTRDVSAMRMAARATDVAEIILPRANNVAEAAVSASGGSIDLVQDVGLKVSSDMVGHYFGMPGPSQAEMIDWTTVLFWYLFIDLGADAGLGKRAREIMPKFRAYLDGEIAERKANPKDNVDDVLNRCLALQAAGTPGMSDEGIRNNLVGLLIGAVPTLSKAAALVLEELLRRPAKLDTAQKAARADDDDLLAKHCWEALRFNPHQPIIYRRAVRPVTIARSRLRERRIPKGAMVFAATLSAAFDRLTVPSPSEFRTDRPDNLYMTWGYGMHNCFGEAINRAVIPAILKPVLKCKTLRYADDASSIDMAGTPFPEHMHLVIDM